MTLVDTLQIMVVLLGVGALVSEYVVSANDTRFNKRRIWRRARPLPMLLAVIALITQYAVGRMEARAKQVELDEQRAQLERIAKNVESLVEQGRLSPDDAKRILVQMRDVIHPKERLEIKITPPQPKR